MKILFYYFHSICLYLTLVLTSFIETKLELEVEILFFELHCIVVGFQVSEAIKCICT